MYVAREIDPSGSKDPASELNEIIIATMAGPEPPEFQELRRQHPKSKFIWHELSNTAKPLDEQKTRPEDGNNQPLSENNRAEIDDSGLSELYNEATILFTEDILPLPEQVPRLKLVQLFYAGFDGFLKTQLFASTDIAFATASGVHGPQITEHIFMTLLSTTHHFPLLLSWQRSHHWIGYSTPMAPVHDLVTQRIGILGYGSIGRQVARVAHGLGMSVHAYTVSPRTTSESKRDTGYIIPGTGDPEGVYPEKWYSGASKKELHEFLGSGLDVVVVATPLTKDTYHLLSAEEFNILSAPRSKTGMGAFVVNISRGGVIDHDALLAALKEGLGEEEGGLRGASLDVTEPEPLPSESELWDLSNVVITPHVSGRGGAYAERAVGVFALNLERLRTGGQLVNIVDRKKEY